MGVICDEFMMNFNLNHTKSFFSFFYEWMGLRFPLAKEYAIYASKTLTIWT
jgi:hypothetical protein